MEHVHRQDGFAERPQDRTLAAYLHGWLEGRAAEVAETLAAQRHQQERWQNEKGPLWHHPWALVFTRTDARPLQPRTVFQAFGDEVTRLGLPPVPLRSLGRVNRNDGGAGPTRP